MASISGPQQSVIFTTPTAHKLPPTRFFVPTTWGRYQLSQLINKSLEHDRPIPFDFVVRGSLLKRTLGEWCAANGVGEEETVELEYVETLRPPERVGGLESKEWISAVRVREGVFWTGEYDGGVRAFDTSLKQERTLKYSTAPVTSLDFNGENLVCGSHDSLRLIPLSTLEEQESTLMELHTRPVSCVRSHGDVVVSGGWDNLIGVWSPSTEGSAKPDGHVLKKRKRNNPPLTPSAVLKSHSGRVTSLSFSPSSSDTVHSTSLDSTIRTWSLTTSTVISTITLPHNPLTSLTCLSPSLLGVTSTDRHLLTFDPRNPAPTPIHSLPHPSLPTSLASSPTYQEYRIASACMDRSVRIWDLRGTGKDPISRFEAKGRVLDIDWRDGVVAVGGEGGLEIWRVSE